MKFTYSRFLFRNIKPTSKNLKALAIHAMLSEQEHETRLFRDFTYRRAAAAIGVSHSTIRKYVEVLKKLGLVKVTGKHLQLRSIRKELHALMSLRYAQINVERNRKGLNPTSCEKKRPEFFMMDIEGLSLEEVVMRLRALIMNDKLYSCSLAYSKKLERDILEDYVDAKKSRKIPKPVREGFKNYVEASLQQIRGNGGFPISYRTLSKMWGYDSAASAHWLMKKMTTFVDIRQDEYTSEPRYAHGKIFFHKPCARYTPNLEAITNIVYK